MDSISLCEPVGEIIFVLPYTLNEIGRYTNI